MTLPTGALSMSQVATELGRSLPLSLQDAMVRALAQVSGAACDFNSLRGKTGRFDGSLFCASGGGGQSINFSGVPWFGGALLSAGQNITLPQTGVSFSVAPNWSGNILLRNNTTGASIVLPQSGGPTSWSANITVPLLFRAGQTDNFTVLPSN
jgi:hypothetical protein